MSSNVTTNPVQSLNAGTAVGNAGSAIAMDRFVNNFTIWVSTTGSPATCTVTTDASFDGGTTWFALTTTGALNQTLFANVAVATAPFGATHIRARINTLTGGTSPTVSASYSFRYESA